MTQIRLFWLVSVIFLVSLPGTGPAGAGEPAFAVGDMEMGAKDAPVTIIEYASMTCSHCANFHMGPFKELKAKYIDTGEVRIIFREFPFDPEALQASMLARCVGEKRYFGMLNVLFKSQAKWANSSEPQQALAKIARLGGFTEARFKACMTNQDLADMILKSRLNGSKKFAVESTLSFIVNGVKASVNMTATEWDKLLATDLK